MNIGDLNKRVTIKQKDATTGDVDVATVWAGVYPISAKEKLDHAEREQSVTHRIKIRYRRDIKSTMRVIYDGRVFHIESVLDPDERHKELHMICEELPPLLDTITIKRKQSVRGEQNIVSLTLLPLRTISACVVEIQDSHARPENEPLTWKHKAIINCDLGEDVALSDVLVIEGQGDFYVVEARAGKHFLEIVAIQESRGGENGL